MQNFRREEDDKKVPTQQFRPRIEKKIQAIPLSPFTLNNFISNANEFVKATLR